MSFVLSVLLLFFSIGPLFTCLSRIFPAAPGEADKCDFYLSDLREIPNVGKVTPGITDWVL